MTGKPLTLAPAPIVRRPPWRRPMAGPQALTPSDPSAFGEYSVTGRLGKGGQGVVYLAEDGDGEEYAVKVLNEQWAEDSDLRKRFVKEVQAAQKVASFC